VQVGVEYSQGQVYAYKESSAIEIQNAVFPAPWNLIGRSTTAFVIAQLHYCASFISCFYSRHYLNLFGVFKSAV
jgi:hypothetical protein